MIWSDAYFDYFRTSDGYLYRVLRVTEDGGRWTVEERMFARVSLFCGALFVAVVAVIETVFVMVILAGGA